jgi:hypothetical protein
MIEQWETDRDELLRGIEAIHAVDESISEEIATLNLWNS